MCGTCVWLLAPSPLAALLLSHLDQGRVFTAGSTSRPHCPPSPGRVRLCCVCCGLHSVQHPRRARRLAGCGDQIKGEKQAFTVKPVYTWMYLTVSPCFSRQWWASTCLPPFQSQVVVLVCCFGLRGRRDAGKITWLLKGWSGLCLLVEMSCFRACISPGSW